MKPDLNTMTYKELRAYVIANPKDLTAFHLFFDRLSCAASKETYEMPKSMSEVKIVEELIKQKLDGTLKKI